MPKSEKSTTIINNPSGGDSGGGMGMVVTLVILLVLGYLLWVYGIPAMRNTQWGSGTPQINVPSEIDVNINQEK